MQEVNYTITNHVARKKLGLTMNEYAVADLIYNLSNNPESDYPNWCYATKNTLADMLDLTKPTILTIIKKLIDKKLVERHSMTKHLRTTKDWYSNVIIKDGKETLPEVKKSSEDGKETLPGDGKETLPNKDIYNKDINKDILAAGAATDGKRFNNLLDMFKLVNPEHEKLFANKTQRKALQELVEKYKFEKLENLMEELPKIIIKPYAPVITTPCELQSKMGKLVAFVQQEQSKKGVKSIDATKILRSDSGQGRGVIVGRGVRSSQAGIIAGNQSSLVLGQNALDPSYNQD